MEILKMDSKLGAVNICRPVGEIKSIIYIIGKEEDILSLVEAGNSALVFIPVPDWNKDLSPYPAKAVFKGGEDFAGGADAFLKILKEDIIPKAETTLGNKKDIQRGIAGYSLAGLFAIYAFINGGFTMAASMSGSLWYPGFIDILKTAPLPENAFVYLSLGDRESKTKNPVLKNVLSATEETSDILSSRGVKTYFELNPGNHFVDGALRMAKGINQIQKHSSK